MIDAIADGHSLLVEELWESPKSALLALIAEASAQNILVITSDRAENHLAHNLDYFGHNRFHEFPAWETLPGEEIPPSPDIVGKRFAILHQILSSAEQQIILCPLQACLQKLPPVETVRPSCNLWRVGEEIPFDALEEFLTALGYRKEAVCADKGHFAMRHSIVDIFPLSAPEPVRIELAFDTIESIRTFDPISQKSIDKIEEIFLCPASEPQMLREAKTLVSLFDYLGERTLILFDDLLALEDRYATLKGLASAHSRFFFSMEELFNAIQSHPRLYFSEKPVEELANVAMEKKLGRDYYSGKTPMQPLSFEIFGCKIQASRMRHPFVPISDYFSASSKEEILSSIHRFSKTPLARISHQDVRKGERDVPSDFVNREAANMKSHIGNERVTKDDGTDCLDFPRPREKCGLDLSFITATQSEEASLRVLLDKEQIQLPEKTHFERGYLSSGFVISDCQCVLLPMTELTGRRRIRRQKWRGTYHTPAAEFHQLKPGDLVVHFHNGIGKYLGTEKKTNHLGAEAEFLVIEYAQNGKLFVPLSSSHLVSRYIGASETLPTLSNLSTQKWQRARIQAQQAIVGYAEELLRFNAEREVTGGFIYPADTEELFQFESDFPYIETDDQLAAIQAIKGDMMSEKAMDRLICGDVGYGKTEVAMRAAFKAIHDGQKQVAVLVPTTVLAMQHYETFCERMAGYPINIGVVSRFMPAKTVRENIDKARAGTLDILIGTHRIISKDVTFHNLGLIIIDEEQRFGVRAKEHLKRLKVGVDCITLSATPIPRTLYMSLVGVRDVSIINTPPQDRLPIKSHIVERNNHAIEQAIVRELSRDGQVFFIHNRVETIHKIADELQKLVPQARIVVGHGQMSADELDSVYHRFKQGEADILVATTIVENGVDIPNANTILIDRADQFGLASLYQLRGRVGRWNRPAYCYFLVPFKRELHEITTKRLSVLVEASGYGGGMKIAMRDLEIRGAGDLLGTKQSGQIASIGFHLYCKLLKKTIHALKKKSAPSFIETKMDFLFNAKLPEDYIQEPELRMELYHRLGEAADNTETDLILSEMEDRFGPPPKPVLWLYHLTRIRIHAQARNFTLLKFETFTFTGERKLKNETIRQTVPMPKTQDPKAFEEAVKELLR